MITKYFQGQGSTPTLAACKGFLDDYPEIDTPEEHLRQS